MVISNIRTASWTQLSHPSLDCAMQEPRRVINVEVEEESCTASELAAPASAGSRMSKKESTQLERIVKSTSFEVAIGGVIMLNCVTMGIQAETMLDHAEGWNTFVDVS